MDWTELWLQFKEIFINIVKFGFPSLALVLSFLSYLDSRKANKVKERLNIVEEKLKLYELEEKEKEREEAKKAYIEARIINISKGKYKMKIWNSGQATAYDVDFKIPEEYESLIWRDKVPYEFLDAGKSFEEHVLVHSGTPNKFKLITIWRDKDGKEFSKKQIVSI